MIFAFLWQEQTIRVPYFLEERRKQNASEIAAPLFSVFNFVSGHKHKDFNASRACIPVMRPVDCRPTEPHANPGHGVSSRLFCCLWPLHPDHPVQAVLSLTVCRFGCVLIRSGLEVFLARQLGECIFATCGL